MNCIFFSKSLVFVHERTKPGKVHTWRKYINEEPRVKAACRCIAQRGVGYKHTTIPVARLGLMIYRVRLETMVMLPCSRGMNSCYIRKYKITFYVRPIDLPVRTKMSMT